MSIPNELLERLRNNDPTLTELISYKALTVGDIKSLAEALTDNTRLTMLDLGNNQIGDDGAKILAANKTLTSLYLFNSQIGNDGAKALAANKTLTSLYLSSNKIGDDGAKALAANKTLTSLYLSGNQIGNEGAKALAANKTLTSLDLSCRNQIGDDGAKALAANKTLTSLDLSYNQIGDAGAKALATNKTLTSLYLSKNQIGNEGAKALADNENLTCLGLSFANISDELQNAIELRLSLNQQQQAKRRSQFINTLFCLALDSSANINTDPTSWHRLPKDIQYHILSFLPSPSPTSIGKTPSQIQQCIRFVFDKSTDLRKALSVAASTKQPLELIENPKAKASQFRFFPPPAAKLSSPTGNSQQAITGQQSDANKANTGLPASTIT